MKALITRPEPEATRFAALCARAGIEAVVAPLMKIVILKKALELDGLGAAAFTSANGVRAFADNCARRDIPVFAIGAGSAAVAAQAGFSDISVAGGDVDALARLIIEKQDRIKGDVLHAAGSRRAGDLASALAAAGVPARRQVLYDAREKTALPAAARGAIAARPPVDWAALFSPHSATLLLKRVKEAGLTARLADVRAACLSPAVAAAAGAARWRDIQTAPEPAAEAVIDVMRRIA